MAVRYLREHPDSTISFVFSGVNGNPESYPPVQSLSAPGARITGKAASLLQREGKRYALATQCIGGGQGIATILEAV